MSKLSWLIQIKPNETITSHSRPRKYHIYSHGHAIALCGRRQGLSHVTARVSPTDVEICKACNFIRTGG